MYNTSFYYSDPYRQVNKNYTYHGLNMKCNKPVTPKPPFNFPTDEYTPFEWVLAISARATLYKKYATISASHYSVLPSNDNIFTSCCHSDYKVRWLKVHCFGTWASGYPEAYVMNYSAFDCFGINYMLGKSTIDFTFITAKPDKAIQHISLYFIRAGGGIDVYKSNFGPLPPTNGYPIL